MDDECFCGLRFTVLQFAADRAAQLTYKEELTSGRPQRVFPFLILLSRDVKQNAGVLAKIAAFVLFMRFVDLVWLSRPTWHAESFGIHWLSFAAPVALGGIWLFFFARELAKSPLLPVRDPNLEEALGHD